MKNNNQTINIKKAEIEDSIDLLNLWISLNNETNNMLFYTYELKISDQEMAKNINNPNNIFYIAKDIYGVLAGFCFLRDSYLIDKTVKVMSIGILKRFWNQGIASNLLNNLLEEAKNKNIKEIFLEVKPDNISAINLYKKFNFKKIGINNKGFLKDKQYISLNIMRLKI